MSHLPINNNAFSSYRNNCKLNSCTLFSPGMKATASTGNRAGCLDGSAGEGLDQLCVVSKRSMHFSQDSLIASEHWAMSRPFKSSMRPRHLKAACFQKAVAAIHQSGRRCFEQSLHLGRRQRNHQLGVMTGFWCLCEWPSKWSNCAWCF